jgi:hypothetical protein
MLCQAGGLHDFVNGDLREALSDHRDFARNPHVSAAYLTCDFLKILFLAAVMPIEESAYDASPSLAYCRDHSAGGVSQVCDADSTGQASIDCGLHQVRVLGTPAISSY